MSEKKARKSYKSEKTIKIVSTILVIFFAALHLLPIWWIFRSSLMTDAELYSWPPPFFPSNWLVSNYADTLEYYPFWKYFKNTMIIIVPSVIFGTVTAIMCGYAFARLHFPGKKFLFALCIGSMLLPNMVTMIPLYIMWTRFFGLSDSYLPLILPYLCGGGAFNIFLIRQFIQTIPRELDEAATIDGASRWKRVWHIDLPGILPTMVILTIMSFANVMGVGFEKAYLMQNNLNLAHSELISTYVYKMGLTGTAQYSYAAAVGLFNTIVNLILLTVCNTVTRKLNGSSLW